MLRHIVLLSALVLVPTIAAGERSLMEAALKASKAAPTKRVRSKARTAAGIVMIGAGVVLIARAAVCVQQATVVIASQVCIDRCTIEVRPTQTCDEPSWEQVGIGAGVATVGTLLATVFSDVPALQDVSIKVSPRGGLLVEKAISF